MTIPDYQTLMLPVLREAAKGEISIRDCIDRLAAKFQLSEEEKAELLPSGKQTAFSNRVHWAKTYLVHAGLLEMTRRAHFRANERGRSVLAENPERIDNTYLERFEEFRAFRARSGGRRSGQAGASSRLTEYRPSKQHRKSKSKRPTRKSPMNFEGNCWTELSMRAPRSSSR
jgi:restriction system protein